MKTITTIYSLMFFSAFLGLINPAQACETSRLTLTGNLDMGTPLASLMQIPDMNSSPTFAELAQPSHFQASVELYDSLGAAHTAVFYFYQVWPRIWTVRIVADGAAVQGGTPGLPKAIAPDSGLQFLSSGLRQTTGTPDLVFEPAWSGGAEIGSIKLTLRLTQYDQDSTITAALQDGSAAGCIRRSDTDFDGDGKEDYAIWRPQLGIWAILQSSTGSGSYLWIQWGLPGDYPMPGDYSGDGLADLAVWRPTDGNWYICRSETFLNCSTPLVQQFGLPGDRPIRSDFDGDGILDFAVWRPNSGMFYFRSSHNQQIIARQWGLPGDIPLNTGSGK